jgi:predicted permease
VRIIARIAPGVGTVRAAAQATAVHRAAAAAEAPDELRSGARLALLPLSRNPYGADPPERAVARWLVAVAGIVLLIAIANVSSLQLARGTRRRREIALRLSLGIGRGRLVAMFLLESLVLAGTAAALGLVVAHFGAEVVRAVLLPEVAWPAPAVDGRVLVFSAAAAIACAVVVGVIPAIAAGRMEPARSMQLGTRSGGERGGGLRRALLVVQPGLALVLLVGAGLFVRSLVGIQGIDLGFEPDRVLVAGPSWSATGEEEVREDADGGSAAARAATLAHERFARLSWVESASLSLGLPFYTSFGVRVLPMGADTPPSFTGEGPSVMGVSGEYFATVGTERVRGRLFGPEDVAGSEPVAVVNEAMAAAFWPGEEAVGRCLTVYDDPIPCVRVVGVVEDVKQWFLTENPALAFYVPIEQVREISGPLLLIRPVGDADAAIDRVRAELLHLWPDLPWVDVFTIRRQIDPQVRPWRMGALLFSLFGLLALLVAGSGLYSVLAYLVEQRRHELAVRAALGASSQRILAETVRRGLAPAALGIAIGALLAIPLSTWLEPLLYDTGGHDPLVFGAAAGLLLVVALAGAVVPARRASRVDPMVTLREG